jgi:hypothetical protein
MKEKTAIVKVSGKTDRTTSEVEECVGNLQKLIQDFEAADLSPDQQQFLAEFIGELRQVALIKEISDEQAAQTMAMLTHKHLTTLSECNSTCLVHGGSRN